MRNQEEPGQDKHRLLKLRYNIDKMNIMIGKYLDEWIFEQIQNQVDIYEINEGKQDVDQGYIQYTVVVSVKRNFTFEA